MFKSILEKFQRYQKKRTFHDYGYDIQTIELADEGSIEYARWQHPFYNTDPVSQQKVNFYKQFIKHGDLAIDIGAHEGDTTVSMALATGKDGLVLAMEPNPHVFPVLEKNSLLNNSKTNIIPLNFAATSTDGEFTFGSGDASFGNGGIVGFSTNTARNNRYTFKVSGRNLEKYLRENYAKDLPRLTFIKTDAEGYDKEILNSIKNIVSEFRPVIISECFKQLNNQERRALFSFFSNLSYRIFILPDFMGTQPREIKIENMSDKKHFDILAIPS